MREVVASALLIAGVGFSLVASIGVLRMPDIFTRMHASTKSGTMGAGLILAAVAVYFNEVGVTVIALLTISFFVLTAPIAAHIIARAAYFTGVPLWKGSVMDDLRGQYDAARGGPGKGGGQQRPLPDHPAARDTGSQGKTR